MPPSSESDEPALSRNRIFAHHNRLVDRSHLVGRHARAARMLPNRFHILALMDANRSDSAVVFTPIGFVPAPLASASSLNDRVSWRSNFRSNFRLLIARGGGYTSCGFWAH